MCVVPFPCASGCPVLNNDFRALTLEMEAALAELHAQTRQAGAPARVAASSQGPAVPAGMVLAPPISVPVTDPPLRVATITYAFAVAEQVAPGSPAAQGGLQVGDRLLAFAHVGAEGGLAAVSSALPSLENREVTVVVQRGEDRVTLIITPQQWPGRGLLGVYWLPV